MSLQSARALVIGGSRGIGRAVTNELLAAGASVAFTFYQNEEAAREFVANATLSPEQSLAELRLDVRNLESIRPTITEAASMLGAIDYLVYCPGGVVVESIDEVSVDSWDWMLSTHVTGADEAIRASAPYLQASKMGSVVLVSTISSMVPRPSQLAYSAAKAALNQIARSYAEAYAHEGFRVNAVLPGLINTDALKQLDTSVVERIVDETPMKRVGEPTEVADAVLFLLSTQASFITGQSLVVSGGRVMH